MGVVTTEPSIGKAEIVPDYLAVGDEQLGQAEWIKRAGIKAENQIRLVKLAHMRYQHPDLDEITTFLQHFGMIVAKRTEEEVWYRGYGPDQYVYYARRGPKKFLGGAFEVESLEDLKTAVKLFPNSEIENLENAPGGGSAVTLFDPEGFPLLLFHGQAPRNTAEYPTKLSVNYEAEKPRSREFIRLSPGPAAVHKLGHYGLCVQKFTEQLEFYTQYFNIVPTDFLYVESEGEKKNVAVFAHIDRGEDLVDHHTFFMSTNPTSHIHHCSFEVHDFDTQQLGHEWLAKQEYKSVWGVGRHILGSQLFDYWWDVNGNMVEHYADGDLVNDKSPIGYGPAGHESLAAWGPEVPKWFLD